MSFLADVKMSYIGLPRTFARTPLTSYVFWGVVGVGVVLAGNEIDQNERDRTSRLLLLFFIIIMTSLLGIHLLQIVICNAQLLCGSYFK